MLETDKYYIERCLDGHPDDFRHLVRRYQATLLAHLAGKLGNKDFAEEAAQETLIRAYFNMNKLQKPQSFFPWLLGIASRVAKEQQRKQQIRRQKETLRSYANQTPAPELSQDYALETAVADLPENYRNIVLLRYYGQHSCSQIADQLDMPLGTVTKNLSRAYAILRKSLQKQSTQNYEVQK
jgi:RNA polymerase sigma-70 factor (ECF subfamily)